MVPEGIPKQLPPWPGHAVPPIPMSPPGQAPHGPQFVEPPSPGIPGPQFIRTGSAPLITPTGLAILGALGLIALAVGMRRREGVC